MNTNKKIFILAGAVIFLTFVTAIGTFIVGGSHDKEAILRALGDESYRVTLHPQEIETSALSNIIVLKNVRVVSRKTNELLHIERLEVKGWNQQALNNPKESRLFESLVIEKLSRPGSKDALERLELRGVQGCFNNALAALRHDGNPDKFLADMQKSLNFESLALQQMHIEDPDLDLNSLSLEKFVWPREDKKTRVAKSLSFSGLKIRDTAETFKVESFSLQDLEYPGGDFRKRFEKKDLFPLLSMVIFKSLKITEFSCKGSKERDILAWESLSLEDFDGSKALNTGKFLLSNFKYNYTDRSEKAAAESLKWDRLSLDLEKAKRFFSSSSNDFWDSEVILSGFELKNFSILAEGDKHELTSLKMDINQEDNKEAEIDFSLKNYNLALVLLDKTRLGVLALDPRFDKYKDAIFLNLDFQTTGSKLQQERGSANKFQKWNYRLKVDIPDFFNIDLDGKLKNTFTSEQDFETSFSDTKITFVDEKILGLTALFLGKKEQDLRNLLGEMFEKWSKKNGTAQDKANIQAIHDYLLGGGKMIISLSVKGAKDKDGDSWISEEQLRDELDYENGEEKSFSITFEHKK